MFDKFHEECGVVGVFGHPEAATLAYLSLYALQHRGQESAGIVASNGEALISHLIAASTEATLTERITDALSQVKGAYSLVFLTEDRIIAARDPGGFRPLVLGRIGDAVVVASETCALDLVDARYEREIEPG